MFSLPFNKENTTMLMPKNRPVELKNIYTTSSKALEMNTKNRINKQGRNKQRITWLQKRFSKGA